MYKEVRIELSYKKDGLNHTIGNFACTWNPENIDYSIGRINDILDKVYKKYLVMSRQEKNYGGAREIGFNFTIVTGDKLVYRVGLYRYYCFVREYNSVNQKEIKAVVDTVTKENKCGNMSTYYKVHKILQKFQLYTMINNAMQLFITDCKNN